MKEIRIEEITSLKEKHPLSFKRWLAREIESGKISRKEAKERYSLNSESTIWGWVQQYGLGKDVSLAMMTPEEKQTQAALEKRIKALEKALDMANLKNIATETMIDIAEEQFNIPIRKKAGPKQ
jgi:transposase-like protein